MRHPLAEVAGSKISGVMPGSLHIPQGTCADLNHRGKNSGREGTQATKHQWNQSHIVVRSFVVLVWSLKLSRLL